MFLAILGLDIKITLRTAYIFDYVFLMVSCLPNKITLRTFFLFENDF